MNKVVMVPKKALISLIAAWFVLFALVVASFQYTNYVDRRSNRAWCGIVLLFNETYEKSPPPTDIGRILEAEFRHLRTDFKCK